MAYQLFLDSFSTSFSASRWVIKDAPNSSLVVPSAGNGRRNNSSMRHTTTNGYMTVRTQYFTASSHVVTGVAFRSSTNTSFSRIRFLSQNSPSVSVAFYIGGLLEYSINNGAVTTIPKTINANTWYYLEIGAIVAANGSLIVKLNGEIVLSLSGIDTRSGGSIDSVDNIEYYNNYTITDYNDFYTTYGDELKWFGDIRVDAFALDGNASPQDWTPDSGNAWERLNQVSGNVKSNIINAESLFSVANISFDTPQVHGVQIGVRANKTDSGQRNMVIEANNNNITTNSSVIALGTSDTEYLYSLTKDTDGNDWTKQKFNDLKVGIKVVE